MTVPLREAPTEPVVQRASDTDREQAARTIHEAAGLGMLRLDETEERLTAVYAARFRPELAALLADLPVAESRPGTSRTFADRLRQLAAWLFTLVVTAAGWARRHRVAAALVGLVVVGLVVALMVVFGAEAGGSGEQGADLVEH